LLDIEKIFAGIAQGAQVNDPAPTLPASSRVAAYQLRWGTILQCQGGLAINPRREQPPEELVGADGEVGVEKDFQKHPL
jgi:hypothetical protein